MSDIIQSNGSNCEWLKIVGGVLLPNVGGCISGRLTRQHIKTWYEELKHPTYSPPNWVFPVVWPTLYSAMGYASYLVWRDGGGFTNTKAVVPLAFYGAQLALNWSWTPIFFGKHNIKGGLHMLLAILATAVPCGVLFYRVNKTAGYLLLPYIAWLGFATALNYDLYKLNHEPQTLTITEVKKDDKSK